MDSARTLTLKLYKSASRDDRQGSTMASVTLKVA